MLGEDKDYQKLKNTRVIALDYVQIVKNLADPSTKGVSGNMINSTSTAMEVQLNSLR